MLSWLLSLAMIGAGLALIASFFLGPGSSSFASNSTDPYGFNVPQLSPAQRDRHESGPRDKTLELTIPAMARVENATVPDVTSGELDQLDSYAAVHLAGTGFPWEEEANVYLAGHRLGYPRTPSFLAFYDLDDLANGDEIHVEDSTGGKYTYRVFKTLVVNPTMLWVTEPVSGKNILTLQTCTLPDYSQRLLVQAELVKKA